MSVKKFLAILILLSGASLVCFGAAQSLQTGYEKRGRHDQQIRTELVRILHNRAEYKKVKAEVEDSVVTLTGSVELDSTRRRLVDRVRKIANVEAVENELILDPPAIPDQVLYGRVVGNLADAGFETLKCRVHEGRVTLEGTVADQKQRERIIGLVRRIEGVKEVDAQLLSSSR